MDLNLFGPPTKDDIKVAYIDPILGLVEGISIPEANDYAIKEPGTTFIFRNGNQTLQYLNINEVNRINPSDLISTDECGGISQKKEIGPPTIQIFGGNGIGAAGNPIVGNDGAILAVDIIRGGNGYQYPPLVAARDIGNYGSGATFTAVIGEVVETTEAYDNEADFEDYELSDSTGVGYGRMYGPNGEDLGSWDPRVYTNTGKDPIRREIDEFQKIVRKLGRNPFFSSIKNKPTNIFCSDIRVIPSKYDVRTKWGPESFNPNDFMSSYAISPVSPSNVSGSDFAGILFTFEWTEDFPTDGEYIFRMLCDNIAYLYVDNLLITSIKNMWGSTSKGGAIEPVTTVQKTIRKGVHKVRVDLLNLPFYENKITTSQSSSVSSTGLEIAKVGTQSNIEIKKVFNTIDFIDKANRTLWRADPSINSSQSSVNIYYYAVSPFDPFSEAAKTESFAGIYPIIWDNINFPVDGNYRIKMYVDDNVTLFIGEEEIRYNGFTSLGKPNPEFNQIKFFKSGNYKIRAELEQIAGKYSLSGGNPMVLSIDIDIPTVTETIISPKSWNENAMGVALTIDAPEPSIPQEPILEQDGRCPNNPIWSTRFPGSKEFWYPVRYSEALRANGITEWSDFLSRYAISPVKPLDTPGSDAGGILFTNSWSIDIPYDGFYKFAVQRDDTARLYVDGNLAFDVKTAGDDMWRDFRNKPKFQKIFISKGRHSIEIELSNRSSKTFEKNGKSWVENPIAISAILIPPPCPRRISGKGIVTDIIVNDPGNGYLPPIPFAITPPSTFELIQKDIPGVPGSGAGAGGGPGFDAGGGPGSGSGGGPGSGSGGGPGSGSGGGPGSGNVPLSIPSPPSGAPTGINATFRPQFEVVRDPVVVNPQKLLQVTDLVGLKQTGYVNGRSYYGAVYYDKGIRYAGFYETIGEPIRVYDTLRESIIAQVITPPSAILRQGTDIGSNNPLLNIPGTVQSTLSSNSIVGAGDYFPSSVPFIQEPVKDSIYSVSLRLKQVIVEDPGINYNVTDQIRVIPSNGAVLEPVFGSFGRIIKVAVIDPGFGFTEYPRIEMFTPL